MSDVLPAVESTEIAVEPDPETAVEYKRLLEIDVVADESIFTRRAASKRLSTAGRRADGRSASHSRSYRLPGANGDETKGGRHD